MNCWKTSKLVKEIQNQNRLIQEKQQEEIEKSDHHLTLKKYFTAKMLQEKIDQALKDRYYIEAGKTRPQPYTYDKTAARIAKSRLDAALILVNRKNPSAIGGDSSVSVTEQDH